MIYIESLLPREQDTGLTIQEELVRIAGEYFSSQTLDVLYASVLPRDLRNPKAVEKLLAQLDQAPYYTDRITGVAEAREQVRPIRPVLELIAEWAKVVSGESDLVRRQRLHRKAERGQQSNQPGSEVRLTTAREELGQKTNEVDALRQQATARIATTDFSKINRTGFTAAANTLRANRTTLSGKINP